MLLRAKHGITLVEYLQVVIVRIFPNEFEVSVTAPSRACLLRCTPGRATPATPAAPDAMVLLKP
jgi:hypothetical protein